MTGASTLRREEGFTVVEAMIAAVLLAIGAVALLGAFDGAQRATFRAEQSQAANDIAQRELEALRLKPYATLAMTSTPTYQASETDPRHRISGSTFQLTEGSTGSAASMVVNGGSLTGGGTISGGTVAPGPTPVTSGDFTGTIQRFIVWRNDPNCADALCTGSQDLKRAVVAVTLNASGSGGEESYVEVQSDMINPTDSVASNPNLPLLGTPTIAQQFWLSEERCQTTGQPAHSATLASHAARDTFGDHCAESVTNRPDALTTQPPTNLDSTQDYSDDLESTPAGADSGLQFLVPAVNGCTLEPAGANGYKEQHIWVSQRLNSTAAYALAGGSTLKLYTRTINDIVTSGRLCVILFRRTEVQASDGSITSTSDTPLATATPSVADWPSGSWQQPLTVQMTFTPYTMVPVIAASAPYIYERIGVAIGLERAGSPSDQIMVQYDNVDLESRIEVETTTPIG